MSQQAQLAVQTQQKATDISSIKGSMLQRAAINTTVTPVHSGTLQRCSGGVECAACRQKRLEKEGTLQRAAVNSAPANGMPPIVHDVLSSSGQPLDAGTRAFMEPRFGYDFSQVRVHTDDRAAESAQAVIALAYTVGRDVVFGAGQYTPGTSEGTWLLAHELTHVVQQNTNARPVPQTLPLGGMDDPAEQEAKTSASNATPVNWGPPIVPNLSYSPDRPLDASAQPFIESHFSHDFSQVRVHTDAQVKDGGGTSIQRGMQPPLSTASVDDDHSLAQRIQNASTSGSSLDSGTLNKLEYGLDTNLSNVRIHTDREANHLAHVVDAVAFTSGQHIFFRSGAYNPNAQEGMHLLAHEAIHTIQQSAGPVSGSPAPGGVTISDPSDPFERAAVQAADSVVMRLNDMVTAQSTLQTEKDDDHAGANLAQTVQRQTSSSMSTQTGFLQRTCACGQHTVAGGECGECRQKRQGTLRHAAVSSTPVNVEPSIADEALGSPGQPHNPTTRVLLEPRFEQDFTQVQVHTDATRLSGPKRTSIQLLGGAPVAPILRALPPGAPVKAPTVSIKAADKIPKVFLSCGQFDWGIEWQTTGRSGFIVQEIANIYKVTNCKGSPVTTIEGESAQPTPHYWEVWNVDDKGDVTPSSELVNDRWQMGPELERPNTKGSWSKKGDAYWVTALDPDAGFRYKNVPGADEQLATTT